MRFLLAFVVLFWATIALSAPLSSNNGQPMNPDFPWRLHAFIVEGGQIKDEAFNGSFKTKAECLVQQTWFLAVLKAQNGSFNGYHIWGYLCRKDGIWA